MASGSKTFLDYSSASPLSVDDVLLVVTDVASGSPVTHSATVQQILDNAPAGLEVVAGSGIDVDISGSTVTVSSTVSSSSIAPVDAEYIVATMNGTLTNEKQLTAGSNIEIDTSGSQAVIHSTASGGGISEWTVYSTVTPTRGSADDPIYTLVFAGVDLTGDIFTGNRISLIQNSITRYGIVHAISFSTNTTITIMTRNDTSSADYDILDTSTYPITNFKYSKFRFPEGFDSCKICWSVIWTDTTRRANTPPTNNYWHNPGGIYVYCPIGQWDARFKCTLSVVKTSTTYVGGRICLSTTAASDGSGNLTDFFAFTAIQGASGTLEADGTFSISGFLDYSTKTPLYPVYMSSDNATNLQFLNDVVTMKITLSSAYF